MSDPIKQYLAEIGRKGGSVKGKNVGNKNAAGHGRPRLPDGEVTKATLQRRAKRDKEKREAKKTQKQLDLEALKYAGTLGHTFIVLRDYEGKPELAAQCVSLRSAKASMKPGNRIYRRTADGWKKVRTTK